MEAGQGLHGETARILVNSATGTEVLMADPACRQSVLIVRNRDANLQPIVRDEPSEVAQSILHDRVRCALDLPQQGSQHQIVAGNHAVPGSPGSPFRFRSWGQEDEGQENERLFSSSCPPIFLFCLPLAVVGLSRKPGRGPLRT